MGDGSYCHISSGCLSNLSQLYMTFFVLIRYLLLVGRIHALSKPIRDYSLNIICLFTNLQHHLYLKRIESLQLDIIANEPKYIIYNLVFECFSCQLLAPYQGIKQIKNLRSNILFKQADQIFVDERDQTRGRHLKTKTMFFPLNNEHPNV